MREVKSKFTVTFWSLEMKFPSTIDWYNFFSNHILEKGGFTVSVQQKPCLLTGVPVDSFSHGVSGADCTFSTSLYCIYLQQTPIYVPYLDVCFPAVLCTIISAVGILRSECDGARWRTGGEVKGKLANGGGSQYSHTKLATWCIHHY